MNINPIRLTGPWNEGFALDFHVLSSKFIRNNVYGRPEFDNMYSNMGNLIYSFKYRYDYNKLYDIIQLAKPFVNEWKALENVDFVIPVPPSKPRMYQPTEEIAREIATLIEAGYSNKVLRKITTEESKGLLLEDKRQIRGSIKKELEATNKHNTLLVDDLYQSGETLKECVRVLKEDKNIDKIYVLTMTKAKMR